MGVGLGTGKKESRKALVTGIGKEYDINLWYRDWDYQIESWESMIERVVGLASRKVSGYGRLR